MKTRLLILMLLAGGAMFAETHLSIGVGVGVPGYYYAPHYYAPAPAVIAVRPPCPGPDYSWVDGYWAPSGVWVGGYWTRAYRRSYWAPHYRGWDRDDRREHDRDWDHGRGYAWGHHR